LQEITSQLYERQKPRLGLMFLKVHRLKSQGTQRGLLWKVGCLHCFAFSKTNLHRIEKKVLSIVSERSTVKRTTKKTKNFMFHYILGTFRKRLSKIESQLLIIIINDWEEIETCQVPFKHNNKNDQKLTYLGV
jgi:hypothetical protein